MTDVIISARLLLSTTVTPGVVPAAKKKLKQLQKLPFSSYQITTEQ